MAISQAQKVDLLWKKIGYGRSKTDTNDNKKATNESISSPLLLRGANVWAQSGDIPATQPASSGGVVTVYPTTSPVETTEDITATSDRTWKTGSTDWIPPEIGSTYLVKVYVHTAGDASNAAANGTQVLGAGSGNDDEWFFDYQSGVLHFIGTNLPNGVNFSGKSVYIAGARYTGLKGVAAAGGSSSFINVSASGIVTATTGLVGDQIRIGIAASTEIDTLTNNLILDSAGGTVEVDDNLNVVGVSTFASAVDINSSIDVDGHTELDNVNISGVATATALHLGAEGSAIRVTSDSITGPSSITIDPAGVGDNTGTVYIAGNLQVDGTQTVVNSTTMTVDDKNLELGTGAANDTAADGGGITIVSGEGNKTFQFEATGDNLGSSENLNLASNKDYKIDNTSVLNATTLGSGVVNSSLTSIGTLTSLNVSGLSTFASNLDINASIDVDGHTELDNVNVSGVSTFTGAIDANGDLDVDGHTELDNVNVSGVSTFTGAIDANGDLDVDGHAELDTLNVSGVSTFVGNIDAAAATFTSAAVEDLTDNRVVIAGSGGELEDSANLTFDGSTLTVVGLADLDDINVSGAATVTGALDVNGGADISGGETTLSSATISDLTDNRILIAGTSGAVEDSANLTFDGSTLTVVGLVDFDDVNVSSAATVNSLTMAGVAVTAILDEDSMASDRADALVTQQSIKAYVDSQITAQDLDISADSGTGAVDLDSQSLTLSGTANEIETSASGQTITVGLPDDVTIGNNLTVTTTTNLGGMLNVTGISTFASAVDVNAAINISGLSELADVSVSSAATITGALDVNGGADISGGETTLSSATVSDLTSGRVVLAGTSGALEDSANLTFDGTDLDVTGNITVSGTVDGRDILDDGQAGDNLITLSGVSRDSTDLGTFSGSTISGSTTVKQALQDLETSLEALDLTITTAEGTNGTGGGGGSVATSQTMTFAGTTNEVDVTVSGQSITYGLPNDVTVSNNLTVSGNLYVNGSTTQVNTATTTIEDQLLDLGMVDGAVPTSDLNKDIGVLFNYYSGSAKKAAVYWDDSTSRIVVSADVSESSGVLTNNTSGALEVASLYVNGCTGSAVEVIKCTNSEIFIENATIDCGAF